MTVMPSNSSWTTPQIIDNGLVSGLNTSQIIQALLQRYEQPERDLQAQQATLNANVADYQQINSDLVALQTAAQQLATGSGWQTVQATSSAPSVATATAAPGTPAGSIQFVVSQLAAADTLVSAGSVSSTADVVDSNPAYLLSKGGAALGFSTLAADATGLPLGTHTVSVTQASAAAATTGTVALAGQSGITIGSGNDTINVTVNGTAYTLTIANSPSGGYSGSGLLAAVQSAISAAGASGVLQAGYNASGNLVLATVDQGSSQSLQVTGGTALSTVGLSAMSSAVNGVNGVVSVDGTSTTLTTVAPGATVSLAAPTGTVSATIVGSSAQSSVTSPLLNVGSLTATQVSTGNGSLADLVANINAAGAGITASAVQVGTNQYVLQLASTTTGSVNDLSVSTTAFSSSGLGSLVTSTPGANAQIQVGGSGGYTLSSPTDTFTGLLPGLTVTALSTSANPVTVSITPDASAAASAVGKLVDAANTVLGDIQKYAGYNEQTKQGGPLMGSPVLQSITQDVLSIFGSAAGTSSLGNSQDVGITLNKDGTIAFDQNAFETAYAANPSQVAALFTQDGSFSASSPSYAGTVSLSYASNLTKAGSYAVVVSRSAAQAVSNGSVLSSGTVSAAETLTIAMGSQSVQYTTTAGQSLASIAAGINNALASAGMAMSAQVVNSGTQLQLATNAYGSSASFSVTTTNTGAGTTGLAGTGAVAGTPTTFTGVDVAGTINGVAATGSGQFLTAPASDPTLAGLSLQVTAAGITTPTTLGTFTYSPGLAQQAASMASAMSDPVTGSVTQTITSLQTESQGLTNQIQFYAQIVAQQQQVLMNQFAALEAQLGSLKNQSQSLAAALSQLG